MSLDSIGAFDIRIPLIVYLIFESILTEDALAIFEIVFRGPRSKRLCFHHKAERPPGKTGTASGNVFQETELSFVSNSLEHGVSVE